jgi:hypothetical protein
MGNLQSELDAPAGYAQINTVLDALADPLVDALLIEYLNGLYG